MPHIVIRSREARGARRLRGPWRRHAAGRLFNWTCRTGSRISVVRGSRAFGGLARIGWNAWAGQYDAVRGLDARSRSENLRDADY